MILTDESAKNRTHTPTICCAFLGWASRMIQKGNQAGGSLVVAGGVPTCIVMGAGAARAVKRNPETIPNLSHVSHDGPSQRRSRRTAQPIGPMPPKAENSLIYLVSNISGYVSAKFWPRISRNEKVGTCIIIISGGY